MVLLNRKLYNVLLEKKETRIKIFKSFLDDNEKKIIIQVFDLEEEFEVHWVSVTSSYTNIMHNKFLHY